MSSSPRGRSGRDSHFTPEEESNLCTENLAWAEALLRKHYGKRSIEWAGEGLLEACRAYDPELGDSFRGFAATVILRTAARGLRQMFGAPESAKNQAMSRAVQYQEYDQPTQTIELVPQDISPTELNPDQADEFVAVLEFIDSQPAKSRLIGLGAIMTGLSPSQLSQVIHVDKREVKSKLHRLQRLVSVA
ncbi:MAG: hypothetical protein ACF8OB_20180 [Phycisphaeraceae bacterium JB051]